MHNPESVQENKTHKLLSDFEIQTDLQVLARRSDLTIINKKKITCRIVDVDILTNHRVKLKNVKRVISTSTLLGN